jgi:hypothetical protein
LIAVDKVKMTWLPVLSNFNSKPIECASISDYFKMVYIKFRHNFIFPFLVKFKWFPAILNTVPVGFKGTSFINFMTGVPLI